MILRCNKLSLSQLRGIRKLTTNIPPTQQKIPFLASWKTGLLCLTVGLTGGEMVHNNINNNNDKSKVDMLELKQGEDLKDYIDIGEQVLTRIANSLIGKDHLTFEYYYPNDILNKLPRMLYNPILKKGIEYHYIGKHAVDDNNNIHHGIITHMLDEAFFRTAVMATSNGEKRTMFTVNLKTWFNGKDMVALPNPNSHVKFEIQYEKEKSKPYKAVLSANIFNDDNQIIGKAECTYVIPKDKR